jgi:phosphate transport system protein
MPAQETHLQQLIDQLRIKILTMAALAERAVDNACQALVGKDTGLAESIIDKDAEINALENDIDDLGLKILAREQPVARDLRFVISSVRLVVDLERVGDEAVNIAERVLFMATLPEIPHNPDVEKLTAIAGSMLRDAVQAFREGDTKLALEVCRADASADELHVRILKRTMDDMMAETTGIRRAVHIILAARALERICDLSTNVAEHAIFMAQGVSIKHRCQAL